jgi:hypothetical protein
MWAFAGACALAILLAPIYPTPVISGPSSGMSAPAAPTASLDSASVSIYQSRFEWQPLALTPLVCRPTFASVLACVESPGRTAPTRPCYGPLYRRPPPFLS